MSAMVVFESLSGNLKQIEGAAVAGVAGRGNVALMSLAMRGAAGASAGRRVRAGLL